MQLTVNGERQELATGASVMDLVNHMAMDKHRFAVEVNGEIVPRGTLAEHELQDGDRVEIVQAIGGG